MVWKSFGFGLFSQADILYSGLFEVCDFFIVSLSRFLYIVILLLITNIIWLVD